MLSAADELGQDVVEALETERHLVARLSSNRAWLSLRGHLMEKREAERQKIIRAALGPQAKREPLDQRAVDYSRGVIDCIDFVLRLPERMKEEEAG